MKGSLLHQAYHNADRAFLAQMALRGKLLQLEEPLIEVREHPDRYTRKTKTNRARAAWHDANRAGTFEVPALILFRAYRKLVETEVMSDEDRAECRAVMRRFWLNGLNLGRLGADLLEVPFPSAATWAFKLRYKLFGAPGNFLGRGMPGAEGTQPCRPEAVNASPTIGRCADRDLNASP